MQIRIPVQVNLIYISGGRESAFQRHFHSVKFIYGPKPPSHNMIESKKELAILLSKLKPFSLPDPSLEQYPTDSEIAAELLWIAYMNGEIEHHTVADFGCGTGILGIGALALDAKQVVFIEIDPRVFPTLLENLAMLEEETARKYSNYRIIEGNVEAYDHPVEVILQNPPFGTRSKHADIIFLRKAIQLAPIVYSLHKSSTAEHIRKEIEILGGKTTEEVEYEFPLKQSMAHHTRKLERIRVTAFKIES